MSSLIEPLNLYLKNFQSYGNNITCIPLNFSKPTLIVGRNLDATIEGQVESNGAGKSAIINALAYVAYDRTLGDKIDKDELINNVNKKNLLVAFNFKKTENSETVFYYIERFRKNKIKGGDGVRILKNTINEFKFDAEFLKEHDITEDSVSAANKQIEKIIGMPFDVFSRIIIYSASHESFFDLPATSTSNKPNQADIIEELFNITVISEKSDILSKNIKEDKKELTKLEEMNQIIRAEHQRNKDQINLVQNQFDVWEATKVKKLEEISNKIQSYSSIDFQEQYTSFAKLKEMEDFSEYNENLKNAKDQISAIEKEIKQYDAWELSHTKTLETLTEKISLLSKINFDEQTKLFGEITELNTELTVLDQGINSKRTQIVSLNEKISGITNELKHLSDNKCPYCSQFYKEAQSKIELGTTKLKEFESELSMINGELSKLEAIHKLVKSDIDDKKKLISFKSINEVLSKKAEFEQAQITYNNTKDMENPFKKYFPGEISRWYSLVETNEKLIEVHKASIERHKRLYLKFKTEKELIEAEGEAKVLKSKYEDLENETNPHKVSLENLQNIQLPEDKASEIEELMVNLTHKEFLYKLLTKKDSFIRKALLAKNLTYLNARLQHYLNKIRLPHKVQFNFDMSVTISQLGNKISFTSLSAGQRARVNIALSFAFRDVLQKRHGKIPLCILDECLDTGLSNVGIVMATKMIKEVAAEDNLSMFVISHKDEISTMFSSKLEVELNGRFSRIVNSDIGTNEIEE